MKINIIFRDFYTKEWNIMKGSLFSDVNLADYVSKIILVLIYFRQNIVSIVKLKRLYRK